MDGSPAPSIITRGERNCNPGNIDYMPHLLYKGEVGIEEVPPNAPYKPRFARFDTPQNGIRAIAMDLLAYQKHHQLNTIAELVTRWAPGNENDTAAYIADVEKTSGYDKDTPLPLSDSTTLIRLVGAFIKHENGRNVYTSSTVADGVKAALAAVA